MKIADLVYKLMNRAPKGIWVTMAILIVVFGTTEVAITYELLAMIDLFGAETFVLLYVSGFLVLLERPVVHIKTLYLENASVPSWDLIRKDLRSLYFLLPSGTKVYALGAVMVLVICLAIPDLPIWKMVFSYS